jgi:hypothetical protein
MGQCVCGQFPRMPLPNIWISAISIPIWLYG